ncbi:Bug family tripartite tricarboxylate transporter substrate binding protein [Roseomonas chloroacetimidivorans]|uniref:Bug family tripartite tricarboxylate transporter substrate binding protein n=1 Tax=Roseomonas chloroacetimidivorans TaxID=1766656 RepID=UPI003C723B2D
MKRRHLLSAALAAPLPPRTAAAQQRGTFPARPITVTVGFPPGAISDVVTRAIAQRMGRELSQTLVVDNRPGAGTSVAAAHVVQSAPDGYALLMASNSLATNHVALPHLPPRDPMRDLTPIGLAYRSPFILLVGKDVPARDLREFLAYAKSKPGHVNFASSGTGAVNHLALELLNQRAGVTMEHVAYRGGAPALMDLRAGRVHAFFATVLDSAPLLRDGVAQVLAVSTAERLPQFPEAPAIAEQVPGYEAVFWQGLFAPAGTSEPVIARLARALQAATSDPELVGSMRDRGVDLLHSGPADLHAYLAREIQNWGQLIRAANIRLE